MFVFSLIEFKKNEKYSKKYCKLRKYGITSSPIKEAPNVTIKI